MSPSDSSNGNKQLDAAVGRFLLERINYERTRSMPSAEEAFKLDRMKELLCRLGDPQRDRPVVHIAGTKGKGSTAAMTAAVLSARDIARDYSPLRISTEWKSGSR